MINNLLIGNITDPTLWGDPNDKGYRWRDIIIAMNVSLAESSALGRPFLKDVAVVQKIQLGSVLTFKFDVKRQLHMLICHHIGDGGWSGAEQLVRYGLDHLWHEHGNRSYAIVQIGTGPIGQRDGANHGAIRRAMEDSLLELDLVVLPPDLEAHAAVNQEPLRPLWVWDRDVGRRRIHVVARTSTH